MNRHRRQRANRWLGIGTSVIILGLITAALGLQSARVRGHIPYLNRPAPTATPAGVVLSLGQQPASPVAAIAAIAASPTPAPPATVAPPPTPTAVGAHTCAPITG
jgi:2-keto-3-deoxy-galactonokinase